MIVALKNYEWDEQHVLDCCAECGGFLDDLDLPEPHDRFRREFGQVELRNPWQRANGGYPCCCSDNRNRVTIPRTVNCVIFQDAFNRADSSTTGSGWTQTSDGVIESNSLKFTTGNAFVSCNATAPTPARKVSGIVRMTASAAVARIKIGGYILHIQLSGTNNFKIIEPGGSTIASASVSISANTNYPFSMCYDDRVERIVATITVGFNTSYIQGTADTPAASTTEIGTGSVTSGAVYYDDFVLSYVNDDCPCGSIGTTSACSNLCTNNAMSDFWAVVVDGFKAHSPDQCTAPDMTTGHCEEHNGTYYSQKNGGECTTRTFGGYWWNRYVSPLVSYNCKKTDITNAVNPPSIFVTSGPSNTVRISAQNQGTGTFYNFVVSGLPKPIDCTIARTLPLNSVGASLAFICDWSAVTCEIIPI